jgi:hypothetical protein
MDDKRAIKRESLHMEVNNKKNCPFIGNSFSECYCNSMSSLLAEDALYYCGRNYMMCPIYEKKSHLKSKVTNKESVSR